MPPSVRNMRKGRLATPHATDRTKKAVKSVAEDTTECRLRKVEERIECLEECFSSFLKEENMQAIKLHKNTKVLETRLDALETSVHEALETVLPKMHSLVAQLEKRSSTSALSSPSLSTLTRKSVSSCSAARGAPPADPSSAGRRLEKELLAAAVSGRPEEVQRLLDRGADVEARNRFGSTPLHCAAHKGHVDVVDLLLRSGAQVNAKTIGGCTALHNAARNDHSSRCATLLLQGGAHVDSRNDAGWTPLHSAAQYGNEATVRVLLAAGANKEAKDFAGRTPLNLASKELGPLLS